MAKQEHLDLLKKGVEAWNEWRQEYPKILPDLSGAYLHGSDLSGIDFSNANLNKANLAGASLSRANCEGASFIQANLSGSNLSDAVFGVLITDDGILGTNLNNANLNCADLRRANFQYAKLFEARLRGADLRNANFSNADLSRADLIEARLDEATLIETHMSEAHFNSCILKRANLNQADLTEADLSGADLSNAHLNSTLLTGANLYSADLSSANLSGASLIAATLISTNLTQTDLTNCQVFGISAWKVLLKETKQLNLVITPPDEPIITVDNLKVAQFIYLLLNNKEIREVIDTITSKVVLILGRFSDERQSVLDALRDELRKRNYSPVLFDFEKPVSRDFTETVSILAHMARFVIADITDAKSIPQELGHIVPQLPSVPVQPLLLASESEYGMFEHFPRYPWVLPIYRYHDVDELLNSIKEHVIAPAEDKAKELAERFPAQT